MAAITRVRAGAVCGRNERGATTLVITIVILVILTTIVLASTNVAMFEQGTTTNENRARLAEQTAEYAVNLTGEYIKANRDRLIADNIDAVGVGGWLAPSGASTRWVRCSLVTTMPATHPCMAERDATRRAQLYFYSNDGSVTGTTDVLAAATTSGAVGFLPAGSTLTQAGGVFNASTEVTALLCRLDSSLTPPSCRATPATGNRIAVTLVATSSLPGESASATVKETWATYSAFTPSAAVPLVASGLVQGLGNAEVVAAPNGGGYGIPASMWSPENICIGEGSTGCTGVGSVTTCHRGEFLRNTPESQLQTTCATVNNACGCPSATSSGTDFLSGHSGAVKREGIDILDRDGGVGGLPDITFYPGAGLDDVADLTDDSLFEWIFGVENEAESTRAPINGTGFTLTNCSPTPNCAINALEGELAAQEKTCAELNALGAAASGLYYITDSGFGSECALPAQVGSPGSPAIVVVNERARLNGTLFYGMLFVRSDNKNAELRGNGNTKVFGAVVVEGKVDLAGNFSLIYVDTAVSNSPNVLPPSAKFGRLPGSWLDDRSGF
jgi:hypothetical protein